MLKCVNRGQVEQVDVLTSHTCAGTPLFKGSPQAIAGVITAGFAAGKHRTGPSATFDEKPGTSAVDVKQTWFLSLMSSAWFINEDCNAACKMSTG